MRYLVLLLLMALASCATTGSGSGLTVETTSRGQVVTGANCTITTSAGSWNVTTPATVPVDNVSGDLRVVCNKSGYRTSELIVRPFGPVGSSMGVGVAGGGSHVGVGVGLNFPISVGGGGYPSRMNVELNPQ